MLSLFGMLAFVLFRENLLHYGLQRSAELHGISIFVYVKTPVYTDVCELSVKRITLLDQFADVQCSLAHPYHLMSTHLMRDSVQRICLSCLRLKQKGN